MFRIWNDKKLFVFFFSISVTRMFKRIRSYTTWSEENGILVPSVEPENDMKKYENNPNTSSKKKLKTDNSKKEVMSMKENDIHS